MVRGISGFEMLRELLGLCPSGFYASAAGLQLSDVGAISRSEASKPSGAGKPRGAGKLA